VVYMREYCDHFVAKCTTFNFVLKYPYYLQAVMEWMEMEMSAILITYLHSQNMYWITLTT